MYTDAMGTAVMLISVNDYVNDYIDDGTASVRIIDIELIGNQVFYTILDSTHNTDIDIGWRYGYDWNKTDVYIRNIDTGKVEKLYGY